MSPTMRRHSTGEKYRTPKAVRRDSAMSRYVEAGGSLTLGGAHQKELRTWAAARQFLRCYALPRALRVLEDLRGQLAGFVQAVTPQRLQAADAPDRAEDMAQTRYLIERTPAAKEQYVRALTAEAAAALELARDLEAQPDA